MPDATHWILDLETPPQVLLAGVGLHGQRPVEQYRMLQFWCLHLYTYEADLRIDGVHYPIKPGTLSLIPPDRHLEYRFRGRSMHWFVHFKVTGRGLPRSAPVLQTLGADLPDVRNACEAIVGTFSPHPRQSEARLWTLLWDLTRPPREGPPCPPAVQAALEHIAGHLAEPIRIAALADRLNLSHNHLTRQFRAFTGVTLAGYIRRQRIDRARHLLRHTTLAIKSIAHQVGIPDLHAFNKTFRQETGLAPTAYRDQRSRRPR